MLIELFDRRIDGQDRGKVVLQRWSNKKESSTPSSFEKKNREASTHKLSQGKKGL